MTFLFKLAASRNAIMQIFDDFQKKKELRLICNTYIFYEIKFMLFNIVHNYISKLNI